MSDNYSTTRTTRTVYYSSSGGGQQDSNVSETLSYTDSDGRIHTKTTKYQGGRSTDDFLNFQPDHHFNLSPNRPRPAGGAIELQSNHGFGHKLKNAMESGARRYSSGWTSRKTNRYAPTKNMSVNGKSFAEIKKECLAKGVLFEDPDFPAVDSSIFYSQRPPRPFVWKRPPELVDNAHLFVGGASRFDVKQGELGDCWLLAAVSSLCGHKDLLYRVVPPSQSFQKEYCGAFCFMFWQYGEWVEVIVDDRLPTYYNKLVFMHSAENTEFWTPLIEKAYAKIVGSYEALKGGATSEAMEDFTGGVTEVFDFRQEVPPNLWQIMRRAFDRDSLMGCSIEASPGEMESELSNGLIIGHAYSITSVKMIEISTNNKTGKIPMVRIRNPWGNECEWKGAWSDKSQQWKFITPEERQRIGLTFTEDGEFWMSFQDFTKNFQKLEICNLGPDSMSSNSIVSVDSNTGLLSQQPGASKKKWEQTNHTGSWRKHVNAGGCRNFLDTFWTNPQYRVEVIDADEEDDDNCGTLIVALMQKGRRKLRKEGVALLTIGYAIYRLKNSGCGPLDLNFFKYNASVAKAPAFINLREVCGRHKLPPGQYCIVPSTFEPGEQAEFLLRIFSEKPNISSEIDEATSISKRDTIKKKVAAMTYANPTLKDYAKEYIDRFDKDEEDTEGGMMSALLTMDITPEKEEETASLREAFRKLAGDDMEIDAYELREILNAAFQKEFKFEGFTEDTCRGMVAMMDIDQSGKLGYDEFRQLWSDVKLWKAVFKKFDKDGSNTFNSYELRQALRATGFTVSNATFNTLVMRYSHQDGIMYFDDYLRCVIRMKTMFATFEDMKMPTGKAEFTLDQFIQTTMYS